MSEKIRISYRHIAEGNFKEFYRCEIPATPGVHQAKLEYATAFGFGPRALDGDEIFFVVSHNTTQVAWGFTDAEAQCEASAGEWLPVENGEVKIG